MGLPYQTLINMYLRDCAESRKELRLQWRPSTMPHNSELQPTKPSLTLGFRG